MYFRPTALEKNDEWTSAFLLDILYLNRQQMAAEQSDTHGISLEAVIGIILLLEVASNNFKIPRQLPIRNMPTELAFFPFSRRSIVFDECVAK